MAIEIVVSSFENGDLTHSGVNLPDGIYFKALPSFEFQNGFGSALYPFLFMVFHSSWENLAVSLGFLS